MNAANIQVWACSKNVSVSKLYSERKKLKESNLDLPLLHHNQVALHHFHRVETPAAPPSLASHGY
jgi:hypothetical protein